MTQKIENSNTGVIATVIICTLLLGVFGMYGVSQIPDAQEQQVIDVPTAAEIVALIDIPSAPVVDTTMVDRLCELTDGCEFYDGSLSKLNELDNNDAAKDFVRKFSKLIDLDDDEYSFNIGVSGTLAEDATATILSSNTVYKDGQVRAYTEQDEKDDNWELKVFLKVTYHDMDADLLDNEIVYVVVTSTLDEGDYDSLTIEEVDRRFEFDD